MLLNNSSQGLPPNLHAKPLPPYTSYFHVATGMIPACVHVGSVDALSMLIYQNKVGRAGHYYLQLGDTASRYRWDFLRGLPVIIKAPDSLPKEPIEAVAVELRHAGVKHIAAITYNGLIIPITSKRAETKK